MDGGFTHEEFEYDLREDLLAFWTPQFSDKMNENAFQAMNWFYSPWPYINDTDLNRDAFNVVRIGLYAMVFSLVDIACERGITAAA